MSKSYEVYFTWYMYTNYNIFIILFEIIRSIYYNNNCCARCFLNVHHAKACVC